MCRTKALAGVVTQADIFLLWGCVPMCEATMVVGGDLVRLLGLGSVALVLSDAVTGQPIRVWVYPFPMREEDALFYGFQAEKYYQVDTVEGGERGR